MATNKIKKHIEEVKGKLPDKKAHTRIRNESTLSNKTVRHIRSVTGKLTKKKKHAQANRIRRKERKKSKRVC